MAEEVKKIITVEVGKSITSVRDFKKHIEDLRGALLGLNEESEEYQTIAEQIATDQAKLNEVMKVGKTNTDSAAGSYNELNNQLKALRNQYKALSETERNGATGQAILSNITKLDTELKDIDESMGQYQRNVGNYKQAFEEAFKAMAQNIGNINPQLGSLMKTAASLIPLIKTASKAATTGLKGVKSALVSTGIGAIVVVLGEIIANWDKIATAISKAFNLQNKYTQEVKDSAANMKNLADEAARTESHLRNLASLRGLSPVQQVEESIDRQQKKIDRFNTNVSRLSKGLNILQDESLTYEQRVSKFQRWWQAFGKDLLKGVDSVEEARKNVEEQLRLLTENAEKIASTDDNILGNPFHIYAGQIRKSLEEYGKVFDEQREKLNADMAGLQQERADELDKEATQIERRLQLFRQGEKQEEYLRTEQYQRERKALIDHNQDLLYAKENFYTLLIKMDNKYLSGVIDSSISEEDAVSTAKSLTPDQTEYIDSLYESYKELRQYIIDTDRDLANLKEEYDKDIETIQQNRRRANAAERDADKERALELLKELENYGKDEVELIQEKYEEELALMEKYNLDTTNLTNKYLDDIQVAIQNKSDDIDSLIEQIAEEIRQTWEKAFQVDLQKIEDAETAALHGADMMWTIDPKTHESDVNLEREKEDKIYEIRKKGYEDRINLYQEHLIFLEAGSEEYLDMERQITEAQMDLDDLAYQHAVDLEERKRQDIQLTIDKVNEAVRIAQGSIQFYGSIANEIAAYTLETAKEGTAEYKAAQITQTIVSTLSGMVGSFSQAMSLYGPTPWGFALGAAGATAMGIIGALRVNQIKNANANSSIGSSSAGASASGVGVEPLLNPDYDLQRITNLSLQGESYAPGKTQVYVLESDIQEVGNRVQVRENNATF